jgi:two-component system sensor histidine kinase TctE
MRSSLRLQLLAWLLVPLTAVVLVSAWLAYGNAKAAAYSVQDQLLLSSARLIGEEVGADDSGLKSDIPPAALELFRSDAGDHVYFRVAAAGQVLSGFADLPPPPQEPQPQHALFFESRFRGEKVRVAAYSQPVFAAGTNQVVVIEVAQTLHGHHTFTHQLLERSLREQMLMVLCSVALLLLGLARGLAPLLQLRARMLERRPGTLQPLSGEGVPSELSSLVDAINDYVRRLDEHMRAHSRFIANASHQLRTPLTVLNTQVSAALRSTDSAAKDETLRAIHGSVQHSIRVVNQLLNLSAAEGGAGIPSAQAAVDLAEAVRQVLEDQALLAQSRGIDLGFELRGTPQPVQAVPAMLRELIANLVHNALLYTPAGGVVTAVVEGGPAHTMLRVEDNGPGIPEAERERVFERFYRLRNGRSDGCGLGLAIVREIASACGATVRLGASAQGSGLVATVTFPPPRVAPAA